MIFFYFTMETKSTKMVTDEKEFVGTKEFINKKEDMSKSKTLLMHRKDSIDCKQEKYTKWLWFYMQANKYICMYIFMCHYSFQCLFFIYWVSNLIKLKSKGKTVIRVHFALRSRGKCTFTEITTFLPSESEPKCLLNKMHLTSELECTGAI